MSIVWEMVHCGDGMGGGSKLGRQSLINHCKFLPQELKLCSCRQRSDLVQDTVKSENVLGESAEDLNEMPSPQSLTQVAGQEEEQESLGKGYRGYWKTLGWKIGSRICLLTPCSLRPCLSPSRESRTVVFLFVLFVSFLPFFPPPLFLSLLYFLIHSFVHSSIQ